MPKIEKQAIPIFFDEAGMPIAALLYYKSQRVIYLLKEADEDDVVDLYERKDKLIKSKF